LVFAGAAQAQTEITWWHSMTAVNGEWVNDLAKDFNASQKEYKVVPIFKGSYDESMTAAIAAFRSGNAPNILQVFEVGTATMKASGNKCPFTTAWQGWTQLESFSAWHNVEFATKQNGLAGLDARMKVNSPLHVRHIENLANMAKQGLFVYKGRGNVPEGAFVSG